MAILSLGDRSMYCPTKDGPGVEEQMEILHCFSYSRVTREFCVCGQPMMNTSLILFMYLFSL